MRLEIESAKVQLHEFVRAEKSKRVQELQKYADGLIENYELDKEEWRNKLIAELDRILKEVKVEMEPVE
ncbi:hypothetical protein CIL03_13085 [Virgibacillus indicus]|uniref:Uncharacterized protein n=1 Tax=Virgibacillus indicus TaxID=2024554 RepID=A0A265N7S8_9BACI|nr:hypothetical protein [Virgibacillus indicus]OZU88062.1 hypothetical protein CIL03_13085 [Virgibacillus indicus]